MTSIVASVGEPVSRVLWRFQQRFISDRQPVRGFLCRQRGGQRQRCWQCYQSRPLSDSGHNVTLPLRGKLFLYRGSRRRQISQRIGVIYFAQNVVRQTNAVDLPTAMQRRASRRPKLRRMIEVLVKSLEKPPVRHPEDR